MIARSVVVSLPFGGNSDEAQRRAILNFKRLEYLIDKKCQVQAISMGSSDQVGYAVKVADTATGNIPVDVMGKIRAADIMIALVQIPNPNVTCEVRARRDNDLPVILVGNWPDVPVYEKDFARLAWDQPVVLAQIDMIVADSQNYPMDGFDAGIPDALKQSIDRHDDKLKTQLEKALKEVEQSLKPKPTEAVESLRRIVSDKIVNFYPCSIVEFTFSGQGQLDTTKPPNVSDFDELFSHLYGYASKSQAISDKTGNLLTLDYLLKRLNSFIDKPDWDEFMQDQDRLSKVIMNSGYAKAKIPLRINQDHTRDEFQGKCLLPCVVAQVIDGPNSGPHTMHLLVEYIEVPDTIKS